MSASRSSPCPPAGTAAANLQRGKRRVALDLRTADGMAAVRALLREADVVVDNFSRRVLPNFGLDDDALHALNPRLVIAHLAGFPAGDPRADWVSYAPTLHALSGLTDAMRLPDGAPAGPGFAYADTASGWAAALAIVAALARPGARLDLAQRDLLALMLAPRLAAPGAAPVPPSGIYRCADAGGRERWCAIAVPDAAAGQRLAAVVGAPLADWARGRAAADVVDRLQAVAVAAAVVATPADLAADPQLLARGWWRRIAGVPREGLVPRLLPATDSGAARVDAAC